MRSTRLLAAAAALVVALAAPAWADSAAAQRLYPPHARPLGMSYPEWFGAYMTWLQEIPAPQNPINDAGSPFNCEERRGGRFVFLGPVGGNCTVSEDTALALAPGVGFWECSTAEGLGETFAELRACARGNFARDINADVYHQRVWIDGERLDHQRRWVTTTPGELVDFPRNNIWEAEPGRSKSVTRGFFFILRPLEEGRHRVVIEVSDEVIGDFRFVWRVRVVDA